MLDIFADRISQTNASDSNGRTCTNQGRSPTYHGRAYGCCHGIHEGRDRLYLRRLKILTHVKGDRSTKLQERKRLSVWRFYGPDICPTRSDETRVWTFFDEAEVNGDWLGAHHQAQSMHDKIVHLSLTNHNI